MRAEANKKTDKSGLGRRSQDDAVIEKRRKKDPFRMIAEFQPAEA